MFPSISHSAAATALGFHAPLPGLAPTAAGVAGAPAGMTQSSSLSTSVPAVFNAAPSPASSLRTSVVSAAHSCRMF